MPRWIGQGERHPRLGLVSRSQGPLALGVVVVTAIVGATTPAFLSVRELQLSWVVMGLALIATLAIPWERLGRAWALVLVSADLAVVGLVTHAVSPVLGASIVLLAFPVLWLAHGFGRLGAALALIGSVLVIWLPNVLYGEYPGSVQAWSELIALTVLLLLVIVVVSLQSGRFERAQASLRAEADAKVEALASQNRLAVMLRSVVAEVNVGLVFFDEHGEQILNNRTSIELAALAGYDPATGSARFVWAADGVTPLAREEQPVIRVLGGQDVRDFFYRVGPPGKQRALVANGRSVRDATGAPHGAVLVGQDVTELTEAVRMRSESLTSLSHELRTPLTSILGYLDLLGDDDDLAPQVRSQLAVIRRSADHLGRLAEQFLAASAPELELSTEAVDLGGLVVDAVAERRRLGLPTGVELRLGARPELRLDADRRRIEELLAILLDNAAAYTREGEIFVSARSDGREAVIRVSDTGIGIPEDELASVFERFHRAANVREETIRGSGLGLTIARSIVRAHGGTIEAFATGNPGTTILVRLPLRRAEPAGAPKATDPRSRRVGPARRGTDQG
ncbi:cell wall metabolism sensor histidine kinase WalK [Plantibacter sp. Leaf314]|uniref:sensor histidine kinase n=1 Tax=Plantibacter sp. Leaf314 TaxID=1736333 RepID=UPI0006FB2ABF|nr:PAS domain-containing sensor histidine kinase [Plantibacter sp. Leaf314]KQQ51264.1 hypothetical protein ASF68_01955 [Plantibacter sp. Leaf314]